MQNYIFIIQTSPERVCKKAVQIDTTIDPEEMANALAVSWEERHPGQECLAAFLFSGEYTLEELEALDLPPRGKVSTCFVFDGVAV